MKTSESIKQIIPAFLKTQTSLKSVKKDRVNPFAESTYATLDAILEELLPKLNENDLMLTQAPVFENFEGAMRIGVETTIFHKSGEFLQYDPFFMELERGSKMNMAQSAGSVTTYAKRYAVSAIFGISTDEDKDGINSELNKAKQGNKSKGYGSAPQSNAVKPMTIEEAMKHKLTFGKHKDKTLEELAKKETSYLNWLYKNDKTDENLKKAIKLVAAAVKPKDAAASKQDIESAMDQMPDNIDKDPRDFN